MAEESTTTTPPPDAPKQNPLLTMPKELIPEEWRDHVRDLRRENQKLREREADLAKDAEARIAKKLEEATAAHTEALTAKEKAANDRIIRAELKAAALKAGMVDLDGLKLADLSTVKLTESGEVDGADALMEALKKAKPYLFGNSGTTSNTSRTPAPQDKPKHVSEMTPEELKAEAKRRGFSRV